MFSVYWFDRLGQGSTGMRGARDNEVESLSGMTRSVGVARGGVALEVNHMGWYRLRVRVASIKCIVW